jgi:hypothetical protein
LDEWTSKTSLTRFFAISASASSWNYAAVSPILFEQLAVPVVSVALFCRSAQPTFRFVLRRREHKIFHLR